MVKLNDSDKMAESIIKNFVLSSKDGKKNQQYYFMFKLGKHISLDKNFDKFIEFLSIQDISPGVSIDYLPNLKFELLPFKNVNEGRDIDHKRSHLNRKIKIDAVKTGLLAAIGSFTSIIPFAGPGVSALFAGTANVIGFLDGVAIGIEQAKIEDRYQDLRGVTSGFYLEVAKKLLKNYLITEEIEVALSKQESVSECGEIPSFLSEGELDQLKQKRDYLLQLTKNLEKNILDRPTLFTTQIGNIFDKDKDKEKELFNPLKEVINYIQKNHNPFELINSELQNERNTFLGALDSKYQYKVNQILALKICSLQKLWANR